MNYTLQGAYILHSYATTAWLNLVECSVPLVREDALSSRLQQFLAKLSSCRINDEYDGDVEDELESKFLLLSDKCPEAPGMLTNAIRFRHFYSSSLCKIQGERTKRIAPAGRTCARLTKIQIQCGRNRILSSSLEPRSSSRKRQTLC